jgi:hypothetical protein
MSFVTHKTSSLSPTTITTVYRSGSSVIPLSIVIRWRIESVELEPPPPSSNFAKCIEPDAKAHTNLMAFSKLFKIRMTRLLYFGTSRKLLLGNSLSQFRIEYELATKSRTDYYWREEMGGGGLVGCTRTNALLIWDKMKEKKRDDVAGIK